MFSFSLWGQDDCGGVVNFETIICDYNTNTIRHVVIVYSEGNYVFDSGGQGYTIFQENSAEAGENGSTYVVSNLEPTIFYGNVLPGGEPPTLSLTNTDGCVSSFDGVGVNVCVYQAVSNGNHYFYSNTNNPTNPVGKILNKYTPYNVINYIDKVVINGADYNSGKNEFGYKNLGNESLLNTKVMQNSNFDICITPKSEYDTQSIYAKIWIDWNGDYLFDEATETVYSATKIITGSNDEFCATITVPSNAIDGFKLIRVGISGTEIDFYGELNPLLNEFSSVPLGEIEDYYIKVGNGSNEINGEFFTAGKLSIPSGESLEINDTDVYMMDEEAEIVINRGASMFVNNSNIYAYDKYIVGGSSFNPEEFIVWKGIDIRGNSNIAHPDASAIYTGNHPNHGLLVTDQSSISHAYTAVETIDSDTFDFEGNPTGKMYGGGIFQLNYTTLNDNFYGLLARSHVQNTDHLSRVTGCDFMNKYSLNYDNQAFDYYIQIYLKGANNIPIENTNFTQSTDADQTLNDKIISGIYAASGGIVADSDACTCNAPNTFNNLKWGIRIQDFFSLSGHYISGNIFNNVERGITASGSVALELKNNEFNNIPVGTPVEEAWGMLIDNSFGLDIEGNKFRTTVNSNYNRGLILKDSEPLPSDPEDLNKVRENSFSGTFKMATVFWGNHGYIDVDCNSYGTEANYGKPQVDWQLAQGNGSGAFNMNSQGCEEINVGVDSAPFSNTWHDVASGGSHIFNATGSPVTLNLNYHPDSEPLLYDTDDIEIYYSSCSGELQCATTTGGGGNTNPDDSYCRMAYQGIIDGLKSNDKESVKSDLDCINNDWSNTLMAATYIVEGELSMASDKLTKVSDSGTYGVAKAQYEDIIEQMTEGSGKAAEALSRTKLKSEKLELSLEKNLAESALAFLNGTMFDINLNLPILEPENLGSANDKQFNIAPNPSTNTEFVQLNLLDNSLEIISVEITNMNGVSLLKTTNVGNNQINVNNLSTGIYLITIITNNGKRMTEKLSILK